MSYSLRNSIGNALLSPIDVLPVPSQNACYRERPEVPIAAMLEPVGPGSLPCSTRASYGLRSGCLIRMTGSTAFRRLDHYDERRAVRDRRPSRRRGLGSGRRIGRKTATKWVALYCGPGVAACGRQTAATGPGLPKRRPPSPRDGSGGLCCFWHRPREQEECRTSWRYRPRLLY